jgi:hypothetical protein
MKYKNLRPFYTLLVLAGLITFQSCKKTETVPYEAELANRITEFKITNAVEVLNGIVDNVDNTITVYIPYYISINYLVPEIKLDEGATLIDADGTEIDLKEDLEPVAFDNANYTYSVKDSKNHIRKYTLVSKIVPHKDPLKLGYELIYDANNNPVADETATKEAFVNSALIIYGNFESSSKLAKLTLVNKSTNAIVPDALILRDVARVDQFHYMDLQLAATIDSGYYYMVVEHQGRKDTLPTIHLAYQKPWFNWLEKAYAAGETVTLKVAVNNGVNTGIKRAYTKLVKQHYDFPGSYVPANFPAASFDVPIELEIISQSRDQVQFKFPDLPVGKYSQYISGGTTSLDASAFGFYFDFNSTAWGNDNLRSSAPYTFEVITK